MAGGGDKTDRGGAFLRRWARRKEAQRQAASAPDRAPAGPVPTEDAEDAGRAEPPLRVEDLPDIDSLDEGSDFTVFLKDGVPESLRRRALRKLWRLNPVFANLDGLNDYDEDFRAAFNFPEGVKTLYQAGKGMVQPEEEEDEAEAAETAAGPAEAPARAAESEDAAALPEEPAEPLPEPGEPERTMTSAVAPSPAEAAAPSQAARGNAVRRRWGGFER